MLRDCRPFVVVACLAILGAFAASAPAQDFRGSIAGTVIDATGGALPGVTITVTNVATQVSQHLVTDGRGFYEAL